MKKIAGAVCTALLAMGLHTAPALAADVTVTLPSFPVTLNGVTIEQSQNQYPMLVYKDITYVPMIWADTRLLGLDSSWTQQTGLVIDKAAEVPDQKTAQSSYKPYKAGAANAKKYTATIASGKITVNGKSINNSKEEYPLLLFRDVTYFPLTWRFAVTEFDWNYNFDAKNGLVIAPKPTVSAGSGNVNTKGEIIGQKVTVTGSGVNLRSDAGTGSSAVGTAQKGETLIVTGTKTVDGKTWYQVMRPSGASNLWIASWYTKKTAESVNASNNNSSSNSSSSGNSVSTSTGNSTSNTTSSNSMVGKTIAVTGSVVNLRANTNTTSAVLGQAVKGDTFTVLSEKTVDGDTWYQVKMKSGVKVWIAGWLTAESKGATGSSNTGTSTNTGSTSATSSSMVGKKIMVHATGVNLRTDAGTNHTVAGTVNKGVTFTVLAQKTVDGKVWYQVKYGNKNVWIASWLTEPYTESANSSTGSVTAERTRLQLQSVKQQGDKTIVTLLKGAGNGYSTTKATANQLVLQLNNVYLNTADSINQSYNGPLQHLQVQDAGENALKVTMDLEKNGYCTVKEDGDNLVITAYSRGTGLHGKVIVVDPGHGGSDPGAIGRVLGVTDAEVGLSVGLKLRDLLEDAGATVLMTRETDVRLGLPERSDLANEREADLFISIHANSSTNTVPQGIQVYYYAPSSNANLYAQSYVRKTLAENVSENMQEVTGTVSDVRTANYAVLRENDRPSILVETGFLSNAEEEALLARDSYRQKLAEGIFEGVAAYFD
ncbi:MAG: N-acetylmuramoyl-L-alanine amidase [Peptococcaceae bacterium]|nr:N-acetylmuramoyl-L-alanine amidase [Peptococcaceae bacterium]